MTQTLELLTPRLLNRHINTPGARLSTRRVPNHALFVNLLAHPLSFCLTKSTALRAADYSRILV